MKNHGFSQYLFFSKKIPKKKGGGFTQHLVYQNKLGAGFTLIELLVVISIISLLASIVLSNIRIAQQKAKNTYRNEIIHQYQLALANFADDRGRYPFRTDPFTGQIYCIGSYSDSFCGINNAIPQSSTINDEIQPYFSALPILDTVYPSITSNPSDAFPIEGITITCDKVVGSGFPISNVCTEVTLTWGLEGAGVTCGPGSSGFAFYYGTICTYKAGSI